MIDRWSSTFIFINKCFNFDKIALKWMKQYLVLFDFALEVWFSICARLGFDQGSRIAM